MSRYLVKLNFRIGIFHAIAFLGFINFSVGTAQNSRIMLGLESGLGKSNLYGNKQKLTESPVQI